MKHQIEYLWRLTRSVYSTGFFRRRPHAVYVIPGALAVVLVAGAVASPLIAWNREKSEIERLLDRTKALDASFARVGQIYDVEVKPIERVLSEYRSDDRLVRRVATALVAEARRADVPPEVLMAVLLVENTQVDPAARSIAGARGLMQIMPLHRGRFRQCANLDTIEGNICYGAQILRENLRHASGDIERALLRYNGCVRGTTTPNCRSYPSQVFARAGEALLNRPNP
jgi:soluble lytic murein transglycosylase-like protein